MISEFNCDKLHYCLPKNEKFGVFIPGGNIYTNISWKIVCCVLEKELMEKNPIFQESVMSYAGVYLQIKYDYSEGKPEVRVYVGQADIRNDDTSILSRNKEHRDTLDHDYDVLLWFTHETKGFWGATEVKWLENYLYNKINKEARDNDVEPQKGAGKISAEVIRQIVGYVNYLGYLKNFDIVVDDSLPELETGSAVKKVEAVLPKKDNKDYKSKKTKNLRDKNSGLSNYTTPPGTVREMINMLPAEIFNENLRVLDLSCKGGEILDAMRDRLVLSPYIKIENPMLRYMSCTNQVYGVALNKRSFDETCKLLVGEGAKSNNIVIADEEYMNVLRGYKKVLEYKVDGSADTRRIDIEKTLEEYLGERFREINDKGVSVPVKFNAIIGNPPYNDDESRGDVGSGNSIYPFFMKGANELSDRITCLITPAAWMMQYPTGTDHDLIDALRKNKDIVEIHDYKDSKDVFSNVSIPSGVCVCLTDKNNKSGLGSYYIHNGDKTEVVKDIVLFNEEAKLIFRDKYAYNIVEKINKIHKKEKKFNEVCVGAKHHFDDGKKILTSTWDDYSDCQTEHFNIKYYLKSNNKKHKDRCTQQNTNGLPNLGYGWVNKHQVPKNIEDSNRPKLLVGQAFTAGSPQVIDIPEYVGTNCVCSQSFIPIFSPHDSESECRIIYKYMCTKFFRYLVNCMKSDQNLGNVTYKLVPLQDFTNQSDIDWSQSIQNIDQQLYKKYNLTPEEITYIEQTIKPMV